MENVDVIVSVRQCAIVGFSFSHEHFDISLKFKRCKYALSDSIYVFIKAQLKQFVD